MMESPIEVLQKYWHYDNFRPLQLEIIDSVLSGRDTLGLLPTGGGKSITFQVPAMILPGLTVVVSPLISLMKDQVDNLSAIGIRAYALYSGMSAAEYRLVADRCRLGKVKLLYISPERLQSQGFTEQLRTWDVSLIVVDEAHCISQWGYDFRPSYLKIRKLREYFPEAPVLALTASATPVVADDITKQLGFGPDHARFIKSFSRENLSYIVRHDDFKERTLLRVLSNTSGTAIVYTRSRRRCRELAEYLSNEGISASYYHAGLDPAEKEERQNLWKNDLLRVIVATNAFGMGIDKPDVRCVVHYDLPPSLEEYYQEAGRAGRDGKDAFAVTIVARTDKALLSRRLSDAFPDKEYIRHVYEMLGNFLDVAVGGGYNNVYEFNFNLFCKRFSLQPVHTHSALKLLSQAGYIDYIEEIISKARAMIVCHKEELYSLNLDERTDAVFAALQRSYSGLFADYVNIDEERIASKADTTTDEVYKALLELSRKKVLSYVPRKTTPYIMYVTSREEPKYLLFPREVYEYRRRCMEERLEAVRRFAYDDTGCRTRFMLGYFGEKDAPDCGRCDVCRARKVKAPAKDELDRMAVTVRNMSKRKGGATIAEILSKIPPSRHSDVLELIRNMADEGEIATDGLKCYMK